MDQIKSEVASLVTVGTSTPGLPDIRVFDMASINQHIDESMAALEPGKKVAFVAYADGSGVRGAIVGKLDSQIPGELKWTVFAVRPYQGQFTWGAGVRWSI